MKLSSLKKIIDFLFKPSRKFFIIPNDILTDYKIKKLRVKKATNDFRIDVINGYGLFVPTAKIELEAELA